jgi:hypothetical protein
VNKEIAFSGYNCQLIGKSSVVCSLVTGPRVFQAGTTLCVQPGKAVHLRLSAVRGADLRVDTLKMTAKVFGFEQDGLFVNT